MNAEIILIKKQNEEQLLESNPPVITEALATCGIDTRYVTTVGREPIELKKALKTAVMRSDVIAVCGGIGWNDDDTAVSAVCSAIGVKLARDNAVAEGIRAAFSISELPANYENAALVPQGSKVFRVAEGLLAGCAVTAADQSILLLPDDPTTLHAMMNGPVSGFFGRVGGFSVSLENDVQEVEDYFEPIAAHLEGRVDDFFTAESVKPSIKTNVVEFYDDADETVDIAPPAEQADVERPIDSEAAAPIDEWDVDSLNAQAEASAEEEPAEEPDTDETADVEEQPKKKKKNIFVRIARFFFPWEGDKGPEIARKMIFLAALIGIIISGTYIYDYFSAKQENDLVMEEARDMYHYTDNTVNEDGTLNRFDELVKQNSDCVGWITVPNTKIDNPVYQAADNDYYVNRNPKKVYSVYGSIFADYRDTISLEGNSTNITLYGHHMKDGSMFANLHNYKKISFYQSNPVLTFDTVYNTGGKYKIFACMITNVEGKDDNGYYFDYTAPEFENDESFGRWVEQIRRRSIYDTPVDVQAGDEILTLSTCTYEIKEVELRCVVVARKIRDGESDAIDVGAVKANTDTIYPAIWYEKKGGNKPTYEDGLLVWIDQPDIEVNVPPASSDTTTSDASSDGSSSEGSSSEGTSSEGASSQGGSSEAPPAPSDTPASSATPPAPSDTPASSEAPPASSDAPASSEAPPVSSEAPPASSDAPASSEAPPAPSSEATSSAEAA